ncbi:YpiB family protein [Halalkalibacter urbisdiaboli]|uniref:YpiB family protein n=1 Tax=Halalkalibacter urbisdiaboli TaxID=1960589 RepID=UPI000B4392A9|nr:YpiB family protein [Halalkalibacter urbisdiaboli]
MKKFVSASEKGQFIKWFLDQHRLKHKEARMLLEYILKRHHLLENISFTEKIQIKEKTIVISSINSDEPGFVYYYNQRKTEDVSKALGDLMANPTDKVYLVFNFFGKVHNQRYAQLIETPIEDKFKRYKQFQKYSSEADIIIEMISVRKQIDDALDQRNEHLFKELVIRMKELEQEQARFQKQNEA